MGMERGLVEEGEFSGGEDRILFSFLRMVSWGEHTQGQYLYRSIYDA